jgi:hypothetical protein
MTIEEFKRQAKAAGLEVRKLRGLEVFEARRHGNYAFRVTWADLVALTDIAQLELYPLTEKLRPANEI